MALKKWAQILCGGNFLVTPSIPKELGLYKGLLSLIRITAAEVDDTKLLTRVEIDKVKLT